MNLHPSIDGQFRSDGTSIIVGSTKTNIIKFHMHRIIVLIVLTITHSTAYTGDFSWIGASNLARLCNTSVFTFDTSTRCAVIQLPLVTAAIKPIVAEAHFCRRISDWRFLDGNLALLATLTRRRVSFCARKFWTLFPHALCVAVMASAHLTQSAVEFIAVC